LPLLRERQPSGDVRRSADLHERRRAVPQGRGRGPLLGGATRMPFDYDEFDLSAIRTYPLASRDSKTRVEDFARAVAPGSGFRAWLDSLPDILGARDLRRVVHAIVEARQHDRGIVWGIG